MSVSDGADRHNAIIALGLGPFLVMRLIGVLALLGDPLLEAWVGEHNFSI